MKQRKGVYRSKDKNDIHPSQNTTSLPQTDIKINMICKRLLLNTQVARKNLFPTKRKEENPS